MVDVDDPTDSYARSALLGREFLTWLWAQTEERKGRFEADGDPIGLMVDEEIELVADADEGGVDILRAGGPAYSDEAAAALRSGKKPRRLRMHLARDQEEWLFTLDERLQFRSCRLPPSPAEHPSDALHDALEAIRFVGTVVDELFAEFIQIRLSDDWKAEAKQLSKWVAGK